MGDSWQVKGVNEKKSKVGTRLFARLMIQLDV